MRYLPPILLVAVAVAQIVLALQHSLTPWKGGGFGMFSSLDTGAFRRIAIVVDAAERSEAVAIAPSLEEPAARAAAFPSDAMLGRLADAVAAREQRNDRPAERVTLVVWRCDFDRVTLNARERQLRTFASHR